MGRPSEDSINTVPVQDEAAPRLYVMHTTSNLLPLQSFETPLTAMSFKPSPDAAMVHTSSLTPSLSWIASQLSAKNGSFGSAAT